MHKIIATGIAMTVLVLPLFATAENLSLCRVTRTLARGNSGQDVTILQTFLADQGFFRVYPTAYFGTLTENALIQFQLQNGIIADVVDGGVYGPRTRSYVRMHWCAEGNSSVVNQSVSTEPQCPVTPSVPSTPPCTTWLKIADTNNCHIGWSCIEPVVAATVSIPNPNQPPIIGAVLGPTTIRANESGTWNILASDHEGDPLTFSVIWGDEGVDVAQLINTIAQGTHFSQSNSYAHTYLKTGLFSVIVFARDIAGNTTKATFSIVVDPSPIQAAQQTVTNTSTAGTSTGVNATGARSCVVHNQYCGDTIIPSGEIAYHSCCAAGIWQLCQDGVLVATDLNTAQSRPVHVTNNCGADPSYYTLSDIRMKEGVIPITGALDKLLQLHAIFFKYKTSAMPQGQHMGLIAQEVQKVFPDAVAEDASGFLYVNYYSLISPIIEALKELQAQNDALRDENSILKNL